MTVAIPAAPTATPPPDLISGPAPASWQHLRAMTESYCGVTTLLVEAGIGLFNLVKRDGGSELELAYKLLQEFVIRPVDERASDEAEQEAIA